MSINAFVISSNQFVYLCLHILHHVRLLDHRVVEQDPLGSVGSLGGVGGLLHGGLVRLSSHSHHLEKSNNQCSFAASKRLFFSDYFFLPNLPKGNCSIYIAGALYDLTHNFNGSCSRCPQKAHTDCFYQQRFVQPHGSSTSLPMYSYSTSFSVDWRGKFMNSECPLVRLIACAVARLHN